MDDKGCRGKCGFPPSTLHRPPAPCFLEHSSVTSALLLPTPAENDPSPAWPKPSSLPHSPDPRATPWPHHESLSGHTRLPAALNLCFISFTPPGTLCLISAHWNPTHSSKPSSSIASPIKASRFFHSVASVHQTCRFLSQFISTASCK